MDVSLQCAEPCLNFGGREENTKRKETWILELLI